MSIDDALLQLSDTGCDFDYVVASLSEPIPNSLVGNIIECAKKNKQTFGSDSTRLFWAQCGSDGQRFVRSNLGKLNFSGLRWLHLLLEGWDLQKLLARLETLNIISDDQTATILAECSNENFDRSLITSVFDKLNRLTCYDAESSQVPPDYKYLIQQFCAGSAGMLHAKKVSVSQLGEFDDSGWLVVVKWKNRNKKTEFETSYTGDWYDDGPVVEHLNSFAGSLGIGSTFIYAGGVGQCPMYVFGAADLIEPLLDELLLNRNGTLDDACDLRRKLQAEFENFGSR